MASAPSRSATFATLANPHAKPPFALRRGSDGLYLRNWPDENPDAPTFRHSFTHDNTQARGFVTAAATLEYAEWALRKGLIACDSYQAVTK